MPETREGLLLNFTREGHHDLVANNIPVFFIQDASKFPDLVHVKPEPHNEMLKRALLMIPFGILSLSCPNHA
jgi:catalase